MKLQTVDSALAILEALAEEGTISVRQVAERQGRSRSSAYRLVRTLQDRGWLTARDNGSFGVGPLALMLGLRAARVHPLREVAAPWLRRISADFEETGTLSILVSDYRICIDQVESPRQIRMSVPLGQPFPLYAGASGRSILAAMTKDDLEKYLEGRVLDQLTTSTITDRQKLLKQLENDRARGYAIAVRERDPEAFSVAAPICQGSRVVGSIAICGPASRFDAEAAPRLGRAVSEAATHIARAL